MPRPAHTVIAIVAALAVASCGNDTVDADKVEAGIEQNLSSATAQIVSVSCPDDVKKEEGKKFTCDAKLEGGGRAEVVVTQTDDRGNGTYAFNPGSVMVSGSVVASQLGKSLEASGVSGAQVTCPDLIKVADGQTATCDAQGSGGRTGEITFTWSDDAGDIDSSSVKAPGA
jgi:Domain of unknown function (DUF4333)